MFAKGVVNIALAIIWSSAIYSIRFSCVFFHPCTDKTYSFAIFGCSEGFCELQICFAVWPDFLRDFDIFYLHTLSAANFPVKIDIGTPAGL